MAGVLEEKASHAVEYTAATVSPPRRAEKRRITWTARAASAFG
jgi:hypothetical protein